MARSKVQCWTFPPNQRCSYRHQINRQRNRWLQSASSSWHWLKLVPCNAPGGMDLSLPVPRTKDTLKICKVDQTQELAVTAREAPTLLRQAHWQLLWKRAEDCFPKHHHLRIITELKRGSTLDDNHPPLCGPWMGCAVNLAVDTPVETTPHRDLMGFPEGMSCLCPFGEFLEGGLILWELKAVVELRRGDLFFFMDHLINHSNEKAYGQRHSVVAFTEHMVWKAIQRKYGFKDSREERRKARRERHKEKSRNVRVSKVRSLCRGLGRPKQAPEPLASMALHG